MPEHENETAAPTPAPAPAPAQAASSVFVTRDGKVVALKAWDFEALAEHAADLKRFVDAWVDTALGEPEVTFDAIKAVLPALRASVQDPDALRYVTGLDQQVSLVQAVWEYNEIGVGLGKAIRVQAMMRGGIANASQGMVTDPNAPTQG